MTNPLTFEGIECQHGYYSDCPSCDAPSYLPDPFELEPENDIDIDSTPDLEAWLISPDPDPFDTSVDDWNEDYWR